jgi:parallel beta-helix repeat protein
MRTRHVLLLAVLCALLSAPVWAADPTLILDQEGEIFTLPGDFQGNIIIAADRVRLDCADHLVSGTGTGNGIEVIGRLAVTVERCRVTNFADGFHITNTQRSLFRANTAFQNTDEGFDIENSDGNLFIRNVTDGGEGFIQRDGFDLDNSHENLFVENMAMRHVRNGIELDFCDNNVFEGNTVQRNRNHGFSVDASDANTFSRNTANNNGDNGFDIENFSSRNTFFNNSAGETPETRNANFDAIVHVEDPGPPPEDGFCNIFVENHFGRTSGLELACINRPD